MGRPANPITCPNLRIGSPSRTARTANLCPILTAAGPRTVVPSNERSVPAGTGRAATAMLAAGRRWTAYCDSGAADIGAVLSGGWECVQPTANGPAGERRRAFGGAGIPACPTGEGAGLRPFCRPCGLAGRVGRGNWPVRALRGRSQSLGYCVPCQDYQRPPPAPTELSRRSGGRSGGNPLGERLGDGEI